MLEGEARLTCRKALLCYVLRHLRLYLAGTDSPEAARMAIQKSEDA